MKITTTILLAIIFLKALPQDIANKIIMNDANYFTISSDINSNLKSASISTDSEFSEEAAYKRYMRWDWFYKSRSGTDGNLHSGTQAILDFLSAENKTAKLSASNFQNIHFVSSGPIENDGVFEPDGDEQTEGYIGRICSVWSPPNNADIIYASSPTGGIWKTTYDGTNWNWICTTDNIPGAGASKLVGNPDNPDIVYAVSGVKANGFTGANYSLGILKTTNGGQNWDFYDAGIDNYPEDWVKLTNIVMHPTNHEILYVISEKSVFKTTNGGGYWTKLSLEGDFAPSSLGFERFTKIEIDKAHPRRIFIAGKNCLYGSWDDGETWVDLTDTNPDLQPEIGPHPLTEEIVILNSRFIDIAIYNQRLYAGYGQNPSNIVSTDISHPVYSIGWTQYSSNLSLPYYAIGKNSLALLSISPDGDVYCGGYFLYHIDGNGNETKQENIHADIRDDLCFTSKNGEEVVYAATDGGVSKLTSTDWWEPITSNMNISQLFSISVTQKSPHYEIIGMQDCGTRKKTGTGKWLRVSGSDGGTTLVDQKDSKYGFKLSNRTDGGNTYASSDYSETFSSPQNTHYWDAPLAQHTQNSIVYTANNGTIYNTTCNPINWNVFADVENGTKLWGEVKWIEPTHQSPYPVYWVGNIESSSTHRGGKLKPDGTYDYLFAALGCDEHLFMTSLEVNPDDNEEIWVTLGNFDENNRVFHSSDGGETENNWTNITYNLPNFPVQCSYYDNATGTLIVGTDIGLYALEDNTTTWQYFGDMPYAMITDIEMRHCTRELFVSTYGRGAWKTHFGSGSCDPESPGTYNIYSNHSYSKEFDFICDNLNIYGGTTTISAKIYLAQNAKITVKNGAKLIIQDGGTLANANIVIESGGELTVLTGGNLQYSTGDIFNFKSGAIINMDGIVEEI